ncbi:hypothetical protein [Gimibacter soli]|uniref:Uncharacterized protein n=1 Tax=Gimibacter soli TaxID=3024400 RepID=A0AAF0BM29_9PROT|nr:hypothetical protein [Gimibacter soli]WCL54947.1 hypothetical protein PH603_04140 [Gimibacter soli]
MAKKGDRDEGHSGDAAAPETVLATLFLDLWQANLKAFALDQQRDDDAAGDAAAKESGQ